MRYGMKLAAVTVKKTQRVIRTTPLRYVGKITIILCLLRRKVKVLNLNNNIHNKVFLYNYENNVTADQGFIID